MSKLLPETLNFVQPGLFLAGTVFMGLMTLTVVISWACERKKRSVTSFKYPSQGEKENYGFEGDGEEKCESNFGYVGDEEEKKFDEGHVDVWLTEISGVEGEVFDDSEIIKVIKVVGVAVVGAAVAAGSVVAGAALAVATAVVVVGITVMGVAAVAMAVAVEVLAAMVVEDVFLFFDK